MSIEKKMADQGGFTLLDILVGMAVFALGILAVAQMQMTAIQGNMSAKHLTQAVTLAQEQLEEMLFWEYENDLLEDDDGADAGTEGLGNNPDHPVEASQKEPDERHPDNPIQVPGIAPSYNIYWNVAEDYPVANTKTIRVIVTWQDKGRGGGLGSANRSIFMDAIKCMEAS